MEESVIRVEFIRDDSRNPDLWTMTMTLLTGPSSYIAYPLPYPLRLRNAIPSVSPETVQLIGEC
jgi:hypothetical protein